VTGTKPAATCALTALPESVLHSILAHLPGRDAARAMGACRTLAAAVRSCRQCSWRLRWNGCRRFGRTGCRCAERHSPTPVQSGSSLAQVQWQGWLLSSHSAMIDCGRRQGSVGQTPLCIQAASHIIA